MTDEKRKNRTSNERIINVKESWDINFWCDELNLKAEELRDIIKQVGPSLHDVRLFIAKKHIVNWPVSY